MRHARFKSKRLRFGASETLQRVRSDVRDRSLNALRQLVDEIDSGRFPGLYLMITGTQAFYEGPQGIQRLAPLAQRLLEPRLATYAGLVGRRVERWHGDIGDSMRRRIRQDPPDILLTTPESIEVMLVSRRSDPRALLEQPISTVTQAGA